MKTITVEEAERTFRSVLEVVERNGEEVLVTRDNQTVARLEPELPLQTALEIFQDVTGVLDCETADSLAKGVAAARDNSFTHLADLKFSSHD